VNNYNGSSMKKAHREFDDEISDDSLVNPAMVNIPAGWFWMGTSKKQVRYMYLREEWAEQWHAEGMFFIEQPQHRLYLEAFEMGKYLVTNVEYHRFVWESNHRVPRDWIGFNFPDGKAKHPVTGISYDDAVKYCQWLSAETGLDYRLPNEAEWERAARGDKPRIYPWGDFFDPWRCNTLDSGKGDTTPVGNYSPAGDTIEGIADMVGNVWEWTSSYLRDYPFDVNDVPPIPGDMTRIVVRGGAWYYSKKLARCSSREGMLRDYTSNSLGFRIVRVPKNDNSANS
jgi:iron(II)-dependent oxidoreductase